MLEVLVAGCGVCVFPTPVGVRRFDLVVVFFVFNLGVEISIPFGRGATVVCVVGG
ncbi:MAG: hypothetical protein KA746_12515 [Pyrinomonadaceae bacterium]|nr:hypothetical protein [Pyrinomonadaceae bacterium]